MSDAKLGSIVLSSQNKKKSSFWYVLTLSSMKARDDIEKQNTVIFAEVVFTITSTSICSINTAIISAKNIITTMFTLMRLTQYAST